MSNDITTFVGDGSKCWSWTLGAKDRNIHEEDREAFADRLMAMGATHMVIGNEIGERTGYIHWQCACEFKEIVAFTAMQGMTFNGYVLGRLKPHQKGTKKWYNAVNYCRKKDNYLERGTYRDGTPQSRPAALDVVCRVREGESMASLYRSHPVFMMYNARKVRDFKDSLEYIDSHPNDPEMLGFDEWHYNKRYKKDYMDR